MKLFLKILAGVAVLAVGALAFVAITRHNEAEKASNRERTAAARAARWEKKDDEPLNDQPDGNQDETK